MSYCDDYLEHESCPSAIYAGWPSEMPDDEPEEIERTAETGRAVDDLMEALKASLAADDCQWKDLGPDAPLSREDS